MLLTIQDHLINKTVAKLCSEVLKEKIKFSTFRIIYLKFLGIYIGYRKKLINNFYAIYLIIFHIKNINLFT